MPYTTNEDFPERLFGRIEMDGDEGYIVTAEDLSGIDEDGAVVAEYKLIRTGVLSVKKTVKRSITKRKKRA